MGDSQQDQSRQRAREATEREMHGWLSSGQRECIVNAIATYVRLERDERMRGEPSGHAARLSLDAHLRSTIEQLRVAHLEAMNERDALRARVAELEAVVRAADEMRKIGELSAQQAYESGPATHWRWLSAPAKYDIARAKVDVPHG